jgi:cytochrome P450
MNTPPDAPRDPVAAVTHAAPYAYYAELVAAPPLHRDPKLGLRIAADARTVAAVLASPLCRVRPASEQVPAALLGSAAGEIFARLVRMTDGAGHCPLKQAVSATLAAADLAQAAELAGFWADRLSGLPPGDLAFRLPVHVIGGLLGLPERDLSETAGLTADFVRCLAPSSSPAQVEAGKAAAGRLLDLVQAALASGRPGLLAELGRAAGRFGWTDSGAVAANGLGFLSQTYEATAGLIANTLVALARDPGLRAADAALLDGIVREVARCDPPIQNTRRFVGRTGEIAGVTVTQGETILVVLAAASRDPAVHPDPARFDPRRLGRRLFTFGSGAHACPGEDLAVAIATAAIARLRVRDLDWQAMAAPSYRPSANARIPVFV